MKTLHQKLERNIWLYIIITGLKKRVYWPILILYITAVGGVTVEQVGIIGAVTSLVALVIEVPSGYLSDRMGHKRAMIFGAVLATLAPLGYIFVQNFWGALWGMVIFFAGGAFFSGTTQALMHETLFALKRDQEYSDVMARITRWSLVMNVILLASVPLTYIIDPRLPFVIGFVLQLIVLWATTQLTSPPREVHVDVDEPVGTDFAQLLRQIIKRKEVFLFLFLGFCTAVSTKIFEYRELYFQEISVPIWAFGVSMALSSIAGVLLTYTVQHFDKLKPQTYFVGDYMLHGIMCILISMITSPLIGVGIIVFAIGYYRIRMILIHKYLLRVCPDKSLKATYISMAGFFEAMLGMVVPLGLGYTLGHFGILQGHLVAGLSIIAIGSLLFIPAARIIKRQKTQNIA